MRGTAGGRVSAVLAAAICFCLGFLLSCTEGLPSYEDPRGVLQGSVRGEYLFSATMNTVRFDFSIVNTFDETLQGEAVLRGRMTVQLRRDPEVQKTLNLGPSSLVKGKYDPLANELTIDPGDTVRFSVYWDYTDDASRDLRQAEFVYVGDPQCIFRAISLEEFFVLEGSVKVFQRLNDVSAGPTEFSMCHVNAWIDPKICLSIRPSEACKFLP